jgi:hypothetical protein
LALELVLAGNCALIIKDIIGFALFFHVFSDCWAYASGIGPLKPIPLILRRELPGCFSCSRIEIPVVSMG